MTMIARSVRGFLPCYLLITNSPTTYLGTRGPSYTRKPTRTGYGADVRSMVRDNPGRHDIRVCANNTNFNHLQVDRRIPRPDGSVPCVICKSVISRSRKQIEQDSFLRWVSHLHTPVVSTSVVDHFNPSLSLAFAPCCAQPFSDLIQLFINTPTSTKSMPAFSCSADSTV